MKHRAALLVLVLASLFLVTRPSTAHAQAVATKPATLVAFEERLALSKQNLPVIQAAAQAAADRTQKNPQMLVNMPYGLQMTFCEELVNRAGGLSNAFPPEERIQMLTPDDVILVSARSWEEDADKVREMLAKYNAQGGMSICFASKAGMPEDIKVDHLIDNGARTGGAEEAHVNALANMLNGWLWSCEYAAGLTRFGKYPGVLYAMASPGATEHNKKLQRNGETRRVLGDTETKIAAGELSAAYLKRVDEIMTELNSDANLAAIEKAGTLLATHLNTGGSAGAASCTHFVMSELIKGQPRTPIKGFNVVWQAKRAFPANLKEGDMVIWIGYIGVATVNEDYATPMRETGAKMITSFVTDKDKPANNAPDALVHIEQHWSPPDAEVKVPFPPGVMAPVSGIDQGLIYRMIEDEVLERLEK